MISIDKLKASEKAIAKAKTQMPSVLDKGAGTFKVLGVAGSFSIYTVTFTSDSVDCDCEGGRRGKACYHAAAALEFCEANLTQTEDKSQPEAPQTQGFDEETRQRHREMDNAPYLKLGSNKPVERIGGIRL